MARDKMGVALLMRVFQRERNLGSSFKLLLPTLSKLCLIGQNQAFYLHISDKWNGKFAVELDRIHQLAWSQFSWELGRAGRSGDLSKME